MHSYHRLIGSSSNIVRVAHDGAHKLFIEFAATKSRGPKTYEYHRDGSTEHGLAHDHWTNLKNVKPYAASLTEEEKAKLQAESKHTLGSEGSYLLKNVVGPYSAPFPNRPMDDDEAAKVWAEDKSVAQ